PRQAQESLQGREGLLRPPQEHDPGRQAGRREGWPVCLPRPQAQEAHVPCAVDSAPQRCCSSVWADLQPIYRRAVEIGDDRRPQGAFGPRDPRAGGVPGNRREGQGGTRGLTRGLQRPTGVALGDLRPAERRERAIHGAGLVVVFAVTGSHLALIGGLLRRLETAEEIGLAFLLDRRAEQNIAACAVFSNIFIARSHPGAALMAAMISSCVMDLSMHTAAKAGAPAAEPTMARTAIPTPKRIACSCPPPLGGTRGKWVQRRQV